MITFQSFLHSIREQKGISLDALGLGICSDSYLSRIESGERKASYLLREYLLGRLGVSEENYYEYLQPKEYEAWKLRQCIIRNFLYGNFNEVRTSIDEYPASIEDGDSISKQFYYFFKAKLMSREGASPGDILNTFKAAAQCSMGALIEDFDGYFDKSLLSIREYCVFSEYLSAELDCADKSDIGQAKESLRKLCAFMDKAEKFKTDIVTAAKIYSVALSCFLRGVKKFFPDDNSYAYEAKVRCFKAVGLLRESQRTYFLPQIIEELSESGDLSEEEQEGLEEYRDYYDTIKTVYIEHGLSPYECCNNSIYAFFESGAYGIGDAILKRRRMFKMPQKDLCEGICSERTLNRIENGKCAVQDETFRRLFERLKLVPDYMHGEIISDDYKAFELYKEVKESDSGNDCTRLEQKLDELRSVLNMDILINKQCWARAWNNFMVETGKITEEKYCENIKKLLSLSIGDIDENESDNVYLNDAEIMLVHNLAILDKGQKKKYIQMMMSEIGDEPCDDWLLIHYDVNAFLLSFYASELGNGGSYEVSDLLGRKIIEAGLRMNTITYIADNIYNQYWNDKQKGENDPHKLDECLSISRFRGDKSDIAFYIKERDETD